LENYVLDNIYKAPSIGFLTCGAVWANDHQQVGFPKLLNSKKRYVNCKDDIASTSLVSVF
jgi:hypothetical protein